MSLDDLSGTDHEKINDPSTGEATLGGLPGQGTLQVVREQNGEVMEVLGTWRLSDEQESLDTSHLEKAYQANEAVSYHGRLDDPEHPDKTEVEVQVRITSIQAYEFDQQQYEGDNATEKTLYNFTVEGSLPHLKA